MTTMVVDCSVSVKWFVPEELEAEAARILDPEWTLRVPGHWRTELLNALWKKHVPLHEVSRPELSRILPVAFAFPVVTTPAEELLESAVQLALQHSRTIYDSLYIALALREKCQFVTADLRLFNAMKDALPETMLWLGDC